MDTASENKQPGHWSDCTIYNEPAYPAGPCDCGGLDLAAYRFDMAVVAPVPRTGREADVLGDRIAPSFIETEETEAFGRTDLGRTDLEGPDERVAITGCTNRVNLDQPRMPVIRDRQAFLLAERLAGHMPPHDDSPESMMNRHSRGGEKQ